MPDFPVTGTLYPKRFISALGDMTLLKDACHVGNIIANAGAV